MTNIKIMLVIIYGYPLNITRQLSRRKAVGFELLVRRAKRAKQEFTAQLPHSRRASRREPVIR